jgi:hypothetical protein
MRKKQAPTESKEINSRSLDFKNCIHKDLNACNIENKTITADRDKGTEYDIDKCTMCWLIVRWKLQSKPVEQ